MKIVTYNIRYGLGLDHTIDLARIAYSVADADIIALQEVDRHWRRSDMTDQPEDIGKLLNDHYWTYFPPFDVDASDRDADGSVINRRRQFGMMLLSKWPLLSVRPILLPQLPTYSVLGMATGALECVVDAPGAPLRVYTTHLSAASAAERLVQIDALNDTHAMIERCGQVMTHASASHYPGEAENLALMDWYNGEPLTPVPAHAILLGDFNFTDDSAEYCRLLGPPDPVYGYGVNAGSFVDSWRVAQETVGDAETWQHDPPGRLPGRPLRIDYCFVYTQLASKVLRAWVDTDAKGSDHRPYWVELEL